jgi:multicomponent Na+:H+ antiporter subunit B
MNPRIVILDVVARVLYWVILAASIWVLLRGHNEPGGGFIGALVAVSASVLWGIARSPAEAARRLPTGSAVGLAALGVLLAGLSGLPAVWQGQAFLTHWWGSLNLGFTELKISTVLLFDIGVYLCVWGALAGYALALIDIDEPLSKDSKETRS